MLRSLPLSSSSSDESAIESIAQEEPVFATFMAKPKLQNGQDNDSSKLSQKIAKLKEDEYAKVLPLVRPRPTNPDPGSNLTIMPLFSANTSSILVWL